MGVVVEGGQTYRVSHRCALIASQGANSCLFELRNAHTTNRVIIHEVGIAWFQTANQTAAIENSLDLYKVTGFTVLDTTNTVTLTSSKMRTPQNATSVTLRGVTVAGAAAGMTGGTKTKDSAPLRQVPLWLLASIPTGGAVPSASTLYQPPAAYGERPLILAPDEGIVIENRVELGAASGASAYFSVAWSELGT